MKYMRSDEIRRAFLDYFAEQGHTIVTSSPLVPQGDPTLLFTNAGMVQFKDAFLGREQRPYRRATTAQKCVRAGGKHNDLDAVGRTARHHTYFEMLGNFSFGDYFKRDAIRFAWEFLTVRLELPAERLWPTIFRDDDEAAGLWQEIAGVPLEKVVRLGEKDNFWAMGETGPCGPCSEIIYDRGEEFRCDEPVCGIGACDCPRWLEIWNLVFMQFDRDASGTLNPLPRPSIDTGMGLERVTAVLQGVNANWDTDIFQPILRHIAELAGMQYHPDDRGFPIRVIADHARACTFLITDGVLPSNEGRGYVLRRILRRAARYGRKIGLKPGFLSELADFVIEPVGGIYPELVTNRDFTTQVIKTEETKFEQTLSTGLQLFEDVVERVTAAGSRVIPGADVFRLYDTFGFPPELTQELAEEREMTLDLAGFQESMAEQRKRARSSAKFANDAARGDLYRRLELPRTRFVGYDRPRDTSVVLAIVVDGESVETATEGAEVEIVLTETPFYGEGGGQVGDTGVLTAAAGLVRVNDTIKPVPDIHVHRGTVERGVISIGDQVTAQVDVERRRQIARHHTGTHLLHAALRKVLGSHVGQAGSLVTPERLRFDFTHLTSVTEDQLRAIEHLVNDRVRDDLIVETAVMPYQEAISSGAMAFFEEKYGDTVRVLKVGPQGLAAILEAEERPFSVELCGGTHLRATGEIGLFLITNESSIGSGVRRIEAVCGTVAEELVRLRMKSLDVVAKHMQSTPADAVASVSSLLSERDQLRKRIETLERQNMKSQVDELLARAERRDGYSVLSAQVQAPNADALRELGDWVRDRLGSSVVVLGAVLGDRPNFLVMVTSDLTGKGLHAGKIAKEVAAVTGGGGGGRPEVAQAGGKDARQLVAALESVPAVLSRLEQPV